MALWQVSFLLLPQRLVGDASELSEAVILTLPNEVGGHLPYFILPADYGSQLNALLPKGKGWSKDMEIWGGDKSDDIQIWKEDGEVSWIEVRIDVRKLDDVFLSELLDLADRWSCFLVERRYGTVCRMGLQQFRGLIAGHPHSRAMKDPVAWLPVLVDEVKRKEKKS